MPNRHLKSIHKKFSHQLGVIPIPLIIGAILVITAAAASIPVSYIINQTSQDTRSRASGESCDWCAGADQCYASTGRAPLTGPWISVADYPAVWVTLPPVVAAEEVMEAPVPSVTANPAARMAVQPTAKKSAKPVIPITGDHVSTPLPVAIPVEESVPPVHSTLTVPKG